MKGNLPKKAYGLLGECDFKWELKNLAKEKGISGASALTKAELQEVLKDVV